MFRKLSLLVLTLVIASSVCKSIAQNIDAEQNNNLSEQKLYSYIDEYLKLTPPHIDSLKAACDYIIAFTDDPVIKPKVAGYLFNHFSESSIMGQEEVAIYVAENYFLNGKLKWSGSGGTLPLSIYVEFNKNSLIGMSAPELNLRDVYGNEILLSSIDNNYTLIYFFNDECSVCKTMLPKLRKVLESKKHLGITVYAVYTHHYNARRLEEYVAKEFPNSKDWVFVLDSDNSSDYRKLYNVTKTPQMFLLDDTNRIIGRNLDDKALSEILDFEEEKLDEFNRRVEHFIGEYMAIVNMSDTTFINAAMHPLYTKVIEQQDKQAYKITFSHIIEYLAYSEEEAAPEAAIYIANRYILPHKEYWRNDTFIKERLPALLDRSENNRIGSIIYNTRLSKLNGKTISLHQIKSRYTYLYFFNDKCSICEAFSYELNKEYKNLKKKNIEVIGIYVGDNFSDLQSYIASNKVPWDILWIGDEISLSELFMRFEIGKIPQTYLLDRDKKIIAKRINTIRLNEMINK